MSIKELDCRDWEHFKEHIADTYGDSYDCIFRGQRDKSRALESTLTRLINNMPIESSSESVEAFQIENFRMKIRGLRGKNPSKLSDNDIWALGQHYGLATPLLDWSYAPYLAAYFAFEKTEPAKSGYRTIWVLNKMGLEENLNEEAKKSFEFIESLQDDNARIVAQAGLFTKSPTGISLESWLESNNLDRFLTKINIEDDYRLAAVNDLRLMNIVGNTVYPDLHGASIACNMQLEVMAENQDLRESTHKMIAAIGLGKK